MNLPGNARVGKGYAEVRLPLALPVPLTYEVPPEMAVRPGDCVRVECGRRELWGVVWEMRETPPDSAKNLKPVLEVASFPPLAKTLRQFLDKVTAYTLAPPGMVLKMALPVPEALKAVEEEVWALASGIEKEGVRMTPQRKTIQDYLQTHGAASAEVISAACHASWAVLTGMEKAGLVRRISRPAPPPIPKALPPEAALHLERLAPEQRTAAQEVMQAQGYKTFLLDGVTGSGKTEVYFEAIAHAMQRGKQVLVLLPEISLSVQWLARFEQRFGFYPAVWHSALTPAQRRDTLRAVAHGAARLVVGARSALFLPYPDLGLIVVDEEHDPSYKQEDGVLYHARDMAVLRAHTEQIPIILTSATPSLESVANAQEGRYRLLHLPERYGGALYPEVTLVDMRQEHKDAGHFISEPLKDALKSTLAAGRQSLLFLNRRGFAPLTLCRTCGYRFQCPDCDAWLVLHQRPHQLQCHHCGFTAPPPKACPECGKEDSLVHCGPGVERIRDEVAELFPKARIGVMTTDHLTTPGQMQALLQQVEAHEIDILIGTQMLVKGHHFPKLALVGVVDGDMGMDGADPRAAERSYAVLHQVAGRAGREQHPGRAFVQTYQPEHPVMQALKKGERDALVAAELAMRKSASLPPYGRLAALILEGRDGNAVLALANQLRLAAPVVPGVQVLGPAPAPLFRLRGLTRYRFLIHAPRAFPVQKLLSDWLATFPLPRTVKLRVDIDPHSFL